MVVTFVLGSLAYTCLTLDKLRLNKQAVEVRQIINALTKEEQEGQEGQEEQEEQEKVETDAGAGDNKPTKKQRIGWIRHPAVLMWRGYIPALKYYYNAVRDECIARHINITEPAFAFSPVSLENIQYQTVDDFLTGRPPHNPDVDAIVFPWWFTWKPLIYSHRASLIRKSPETYAPKFQSETKVENAHEVAELIPFLDKGYVWPTKLVPAQIAAFTPNDCAPIGAGAPPTFRWSRDDVAAWMAQPLVNPKTGRPIKAGGGKMSIYADLAKAKKLYKM